MKKNRIFKLLIKLVLLISLVGVATFFTVKIRADGNTVYLKDAVIEANDSGIVVAEIVGEGKAGDNINVFVHTEGGTAIPGLDYASVDTLVRATYGSDGKLSYKLSVKCLVTAESREKLRAYDKSNTYGRYFKLVIEKATNASVNTEKNTAKCYLPYNHKAEIVTGKTQDMATRDDVPYAYFKEYEKPLTQYNKGKDNIDGKSSWRSWEHDMSFNNETTSNWINVFINQNMASAYGTYTMRKCSDANGVWAWSESHIYLKYGNKQLIESMNDDYNKNDGCPGTGLYVKCTTVLPSQKYFWSDFDFYAEEIRPKTMKTIIIDKKCPYDDDDDTLNTDDISVKSEARTIRWYQETDEWFGKTGNFNEAGAVKIEPYNGVLDTGLAVFNDNKEYDIEVRYVHEYLALVDSKTPEILGEFVDDSGLATTGKLRIYLRFSEPVMIDGTEQTNYLSVNFNGGTDTFNAHYVEGNYSDTLVFEVEPPKVNIRDIKYQLPTGLIGDLAYNLDEYKVVQNNRIPKDVTDKDRTLTFLNGAVNLLKPTLAIDQSSGPSTSPNNIYNILLSINNNGEKDLKDGTVYYTFDTTEEWVKEGTTSTYTTEELANPDLYKNNHKFTPEENGSLSLTLVKNESEGILSGVYYLHALAVSGYGLTDVHTFGPYNLDGDPPDANQLRPDPNTLTDKTYKLDLKNKTTEVNNVYVKLKYKDKNGASQEKAIQIVRNKNKVDAIQDKVGITPGSDNNTIYSYTSNINDAEIQEILTANGVSRMEFDATFYIEDVAGNKSTSNMIKVSYDSRPLFDASLNVPKAHDNVKGYTEINDINVSADVYDLSTIGESSEEKDIYIDVVDNSANGNARTYISKGAVFSVTINGKTKIDAGDGNKYRVVLSNLEPGYYDIVPRISGTVDGNNVDLVADNIQFYITNNKTDMTLNKQAMSEDLVLSNKVFQLQDQRYYYLSEDGSTVISYAYGGTYDKEANRAQGGSTYPTFSNVNEAKKYVKYMELQDLYLVKLTPTQASLLNSGSATTAYVKAAGESVTAQEGQLWIRYKKNTWENTANAYGWGYYYYGNGNIEDGININSLSANLTSAMNDVINRISNTGKTVYLVEEANLDTRTGAPYLASTQIHAKAEEATTNQVGNNKFVSAVKYDGDKDIYKNSVTVKVGEQNIEYALATNLTLKVTSSSRFFYQYTPTDDPNNTTWKEIAVTDGAKLSEVLPNQTSGPYLLREYSDSGVSEYYIYYDKSIPNLSVVVGDTPMTLDGTVLQYSSDSFIIKGFTNSIDFPTEIDDMAYVALYSYPGKKLIEVLYASDFANSDKKLDEKNYYVQVGDRSGNIALYTVLLSNSELEVDVAENEAKTSVVVKVYDRAENEIYSYEVYCNEVLVTTEFAETKNFKEPGIYRVRVVDIYGNEVTKTAEFAFKIPEINWYYLTKEDSYGKYNPENIVSMAIYDDPNNSRITNIYTAAMLKLQFVTAYDEDPVKFEILDLASSDYSYSDATQVITINKLAGFRLRVWYETLPQNDHTFVIKVDNDAPTVSATFVGKSFVAYSEKDSNGNITKTAAFDQVNLENYNKGDSVCVDTLAYVSDSSESEKVFENGAVISGGHIVLGFADPSNIKSFDITRNGQKIEMELDSDQKLILNTAGYYEVVVSDMLGNIRKFTFTNTNEPITQATIDGEELQDSVKSYGHSNLTVKYIYPGENRILVETPNGKETLVFKYDGRYISYGSYVCEIEKRQNDSGEIVDIKVAEYVANPDFSLDLNDTNLKANNWYTALENEYYTISIMIVEKQPVLKLELVEIEDAEKPIINVEMLYNAGNTVSPSYYIASLSNEKAEVTIYSGYTEVDPNVESKYIYVAEILNIDPHVSQNISTISFGFSDRPEVQDLKVVYENGKFTTALIGVKEGFYKIVVVNIFNNKTEYIICKVDSFKTIVEVIHLDGTVIEYLENNGVIYSNSRINFDVYSDNAKFEVDGEEYAGVRESGIITLEVYKQGEHTVTVIGANNIREDFHININTNQEFIFNEDWLTGYTEKALLKDQGYTSTALTANKADDVEYIAYKYGDLDIQVLYDNISEVKKLNKDALISAIGNDGAGDYTVYFKNIYGDVGSKTIHFNDNPALVLSRKTVNENNAFAAYDLYKALNKGFYSNYILKFETSSLKYEFKINDAIVSLDEPKTLEFSNASGNGSFEYQISYLDEYGNYLEFKAYLYRTDIKIDTTLITEIVNGSNTYTRNNIIIMFSDDLTGYVSVDNGDRIPYESGTTFYKDGRYDFIVEDIAGNRANYVINHKSINHYTLTNSANQGRVILDSVINNGSVVFQATDDSKIIKVFKNSQLVSDYESNSFTTTGHWEILIEDSVGNQSYAGFYIVNNPLISFEYEAPFEYEITEIWHTKLDGHKESIEAEKGKPIVLTENGDYVVVVTSTNSTTSFNFTVTINDTPPTATLEGVEDGGVTARNVTIKGLKNGDVVEIYKDDKLVSTTDISVSNEAPEIATGGNYRVVIKSVSGATTEYSFTRKQIANTATSIFIIVACLAVILGIGIGLLYHTKIKNDSEK